MQITSRFTIAIHMLTAIHCFKEPEKRTSSFLAGSIGVNPVIVRNVMGQLKEAGLISSSQGRSGMSLKKDLKDITFYDVYKAIDGIGKEGLFHFHEHPNMKCYVGRNIHKALDGRLRQVQKAMEDEMRSITVADVVNDVKNLAEHEK